MISSAIKEPIITIEPLNQSQKGFKSDLNEIFKINEQVGWGKYNSRSMTRRAHAEPCPYLVAKIEGAVAGYIISEESREEAYVPYIATNLDFRNRGVGEQLMLAAIEKAREENLTGMRLEYRGNKEHLKKFYEQTIPSRAGCTATTTLKGFYLNGDPKVGVNYEL